MKKLLYCFNKIHVVLKNMCESKMSQQCLHTLISKHLSINESTHSSLACSAGVFWTRKCTFLYLGHHLGFGNCGGLGRGNIYMYRSTIQDGGVQTPIYYLAFRSKITQLHCGLIVAQLFYNLSDKNSYLFFFCFYHEKI